MKNTGSLVVRMWIDDRSTSKTGTLENNWRTFRVDRMRNVTVHEDETFEKRPGFKEGDDGSMDITFVSTDFDKEPEDIEVPVDTTQPDIEPTDIEPTDIEPDDTEKPDIEPITIPKEPEDTEKPVPPADREVVPPVKPEEPNNNEFTELPKEDIPPLDPDDEMLELNEEIKRIKKLLYY
jgi:hypothetical protein